LEGTRAFLGGAKLFGRGEMPAEYKNIPGFPLPEIDTNFLLTYLIYDVGWIAFIIIMSVLLFFIIKGLMLCFRQKSALGTFVSVSVISTFTMQVFGYVIVNLGFPLFSLSLPLISYGNIATIINLSLIGLMLSVFRTGDVVKDKHAGIIQKDDFITWSDGKFIISFGKK
jgi:cell division protein FtsW (lipid II flippase)